MTRARSENSRQFAVIAGSGFTGFGVEEENRVDPRPMTTRFGPPSAPIRRVRNGRHDVLMLARHGDDISIPPHAINYRANLEALRLLDADSIVALNTVGVIPTSLHPGQLAVPVQLIDFTWGRAHSIYDGEGPDIDHIDFTSPFSESLRQSLLAAARDANIVCHDGGTYGVTQGPRLETAGEVDRFERDGIDFLGMTAMPEAALARELGMEYACLSLIVNQAAGRGAAAIHTDIEASTLTAKSQALKVLKRFFAQET